MVCKQYYWACENSAGRKYYYVVGLVDDFVEAGSCNLDLQTAGFDQVVLVVVVELKQKFLVKRITLYFID